MKINMLWDLTPCTDVSEVLLPLSWGQFKGASETPLYSTNLISLLYV